MQGRSKWPFGGSWHATQVEAGMLWHLEQVTCT
jgi:hypothetical protein